MKYPCSLIQDLLPLYHDGVCSEESNKIIEAHLSECSSCKDYYNSLLYLHLPYLRSYLFRLSAF